MEQGIELWKVLLMLAVVLTIAIGGMVYLSKRGGVAGTAAKGILTAAEHRIESIDLPGDWDNKIRDAIKAGTLDDVIEARVQALIASGAAMGRSAAAAIDADIAKVRAWADARVAELKSGKPVSSTPPPLATATPAPAAKVMVRAPGPENQPSGNWHLPPAAPAAADAQAAPASTLQVPLAGEGLDAYAERCGLTNIIVTLRTIAAIHPGLGWDQVAALAMDPHSNREIVATPADRDTIAAAAAEPATLQATA